MLHFCLPNDFFQFAPLYGLYLPSKGCGEFVEVILKIRILDSDIVLSYSDKDVSLILAREL